jgi:acetyltransferase-like isoleucine patch superfamily enzyme
MGAKIGDHCELSSHVRVCADRLTLGNHCFVADDILLGLPEVDDGMVTHGHVT